MAVDKHPPHKVLFLSTKNAARSQMAEAITNAQFYEHWQAHSAGTELLGYVHPKTNRVLREIGIEHHGHAKPISEVDHLDFMLVVIIYDVTHETAPTWPSTGRRVSLNIPDPIVINDDPQTIITAFRQARDDLIQQIPALLKWATPTTD